MHPHILLIGNYELMPLYITDITRYVLLLLLHASQAPFNRLFLLCGKAVLVSSLSETMLFVVNRLGVEECWVKFRLLAFLGNANFTELTSDISQDGKLTAQVHSAAR